MLDEMTRASLHKWTLLLLDVSLVAIATILSIVVRDNFDISMARIGTLMPYLLASVVGAAVTLSLVRAHRTIWRFSSMGDYLQLVAASFFIVVIATAMTFLVQRLEGLPRALPVIQFLLVSTMLVGARVATRVRHQRRQRRPIGGPLLAEEVEETTLVIGITVATDLFLRAVAEFAPQRVKIAGILANREGLGGRLLHQYPVLGVPEDIEGVLQRLEVHGIFVNRIVVTVPFAYLSERAQNALLDVESRSDIRVEFIVEQLGLEAVSNLPRSGSRQPSAFALAPIERRAARPYFKVKVLFDRILASILMLLCLPILALIALLVAVDVGTPVLFWQQRPGIGGRPFRLYKFRTMRAAHNGSGRRMLDDERVSAIGNFLRRSRLDELPQLYNIVLGDMSFIGPRPLLPIDQTPEFVARLLVRPGMTGWAQVAGGRAVSARDKAALDIWYVCNASLWTDLSIVLRTIPMIMLGERLDKRAVDQAWQELESFSADCGAHSLDYRDA